jgi:hypothetical protein
MYRGESGSCGTGATLVPAADTDGWRARAEDKRAGARKKPWTVTASSKASRRQSDEGVEDGMLMLVWLGTGWGLPVLDVCKDCV